MTISLLFAPSIITFLLKLIEVKKLQPIDHHCLGQSEPVFVKVTKLLDGLVLSFLSRSS